MKRELKTRPTYECRCDERLKTKAEESTSLAYTGLIRELEHLKTETRLIDEMFATEKCARACRYHRDPLAEIKEEKKKRSGS
jgi:hypothetical protein